LKSILRKHQWLIKLGKALLKINSWNFQQFSVILISDLFINFRIKMLSSGLGVGQGANNLTGKKKLITKCYTGPPLLT
jgi:hypothetical protein